MSEEKNIHSRSWNNIDILVHLQRGVVLSLNRFMTCQGDRLQ